MEEKRFHTDDLTTVSYRKRELIMYPVQKHELEILVSGYNSIHFALFGVFFGASLTLWVTLNTVPLQEPMATRCWLGSLAFGIAWVICGLMAIKDYLNSKKILKAIKSETVDVVVGPRAGGI